MPAAAILLVISAALAAQSPRFELTQQDLFAAGGSFVNAWADYDGDGDLDLFVGFDGMPNRLYRNENGRFSDTAAAAGIADARPTRAAAWGDADGDGDSDLLVGFTPASAKPSAGSAPAASTPGPSGAASVLTLYRNTRGVFTDDTNAVGLSLASGAVRQPVWVDFDADGDLDLFVAFRDRANAMFRNDAGRFVDVAAEIGLADARRTVGAVWFDHDEDGDLDVIVGNMDGDANGLFSQQDGKFIDVAVTAGVAWGGRAPNDKTNGTVRPCVADVNSDGRLDLFFANYGTNGLFLNRGKGRFEDVSAAWGIDMAARYDSCAFADIDNDGDLDLYVNGTVTGGTQYPDYLFRNTGTRFEDVTPAEIGSPNSDHGVQWADYDLDGAIDLALTGVEKTGMHWLLRNTLATTAQTRAINLRVLDATGRSVLAGSTVTIEVGANQGTPRRTTHLVDGGSGYNAQNDAPLHVAVPDTTNITLTIRTRRPGGVDAVSTQQLDLRGWPRRVFEHRLALPTGGLVIEWPAPPDKVMLVHQEPRHHLVFDSPGTRILDVQIPPGDTTLFHTHSDPILYVTMSTSRTRSQNLGADWSAPAADAPAAPGASVAPAAPVTPAPARPAAPASPVPPLSPSVPRGRMMSTTSYAERPQTHRVHNIGSTLFRLIGITNSSAGDDTAAPSDGFDTEPEIGSRWFRGYRRVVTAQDSAEHRHANPVAIVLVAGAARVGTATTPSAARSLREPGAFVFLDAGTPHVVRADAPDTELVEVEVRRPR
jgi:hypothetical protein